MLNKLRRFSDAAKEIERLEERIQRLEAKMESPRTSDFSGMPKSPSPDHDQILNSIVARDELKERYVDLVTKLCKQQSEIETAIETLEPVERDLLRFRYFDNLPWWKVANKLNYGQRQVFNVHNAAIKKLEKNAKKL